MTESQPPTAEGNGDTASGGNPMVMRGNPIANSTMVTPGRGQDDWRTALARIADLEAALRGGATGSSNLGKVISEGITNGMSKMQELSRTREKRARSPEGGPDAPTLEVINIQGSDDNHRQFCWELRRMYKQPNAKPEDYWMVSKYPLNVSPNLRGNLYLDHLVPLSISSKALGWLHGAKENILVNYFTHKNRIGKRKKKEGITVQSGVDAMGATNLSLSEPWEESADIKEVIDGLFNIQAGVFQIRPWDWTPMVIHRVLHEVSYFSGCSNSRVQQKELVEDFINGALYQARTSLGQGSPPTNYKDTKLIAEDIVSNKNGRGSELCRKGCVYGAKWELVEKDREIEQLKAKNTRLQNEINNLRKGAKVGNNGPRQVFDNDFGQNRRGRGGRGGNARGRGSGSYSNQPRDEAFFQARLKLCLKYNQGQCDDATQCGLNHACNRKVAPGTVCGHAHRGREHQ